MSIVLFTIIRGLTDTWLNNMKRSNFFDGQFAPKLGGQFELKLGGQFTPESYGQLDRFFQ